MADDRSVGYTYSGGAFRAFPGYEVQAAGLPSGAMVAGATDMARFMIAHLHGGAYRDEAGTTRRILEAATARQMRATLYTPDARLLGTATGSFDITDNGQRTLDPDQRLRRMRIEPTPSAIAVRLPEASSCASAGCGRGERA